LAFAREPFGSVIAPESLPPYWEFLVVFYAIDYEVHAIPGFLYVKAAVLRTG
jgi:hypothetical protein